MKYWGLKPHAEMNFSQFSVQCPSCQTEVPNYQIIEKRGSLGCTRCLKV